MRAFVAAVLLVLSITASNASCIGIGTLAAQLEDTPWTSTILVGEQLAKAKRIYNATPPESDNEVSEAILIGRPDGGGFLAVGPTGSYCGLLTYDAERFRALVKTLIGQAI